MTWVRLSDQTANDEALCDSGNDAMLLWYIALTECAAINDGAGNDGLMTSFLVRTSCSKPEKALNQKRCPARLVEQGMWHDHESVKACPDCMDNGGARCQPGMFFIHQWWEKLLRAETKNDGVKRDREARRKALNNDVKLVAQIRTRDRDLCRYCGDPTEDSSGPNKRGKKVRHLDHVDPWGDNSLTNVVVACRDCNSRLKKQRTPEDAGMTLWVPGTTRADIEAGTAIALRPAPARSTAGNRPGPAGSEPAGSATEPAADPAEPPLEPDHDPASRAHTRDSGTGQVGPGPRPVLAGSGPAGPALATTTTNGTNGHHHHDPGDDAA